MLKKITWGLKIRYKNSFCVPIRETCPPPGVKMVTGPYARREAASCLAEGPPGRPPWTSAPGRCLSSASSPGPPGASGRKGRGPLLWWEMPELSVSGKRMFKRLAWVSVSHSSWPCPPAEHRQGFLPGRSPPRAPRLMGHLTQCYIDNSCSLSLSNTLS